MDKKGESEILLYFISGILYSPIPRSSYSNKALYISFFAFLIELGLHCCMHSLVVASKSYSLVEVCEFLIVVASLVAEHGL